MPYRRKYTRPTEGFVQKRARVYGGAAKLGYQDISSVAKQVAYLGSLVNSEPKYHTVMFNNNFTWAGSVIDLCVVPQGDSVNSRDGNSILPRYLNIKMRIKKAVTLPVASTVDHGTFRLVIFRYWGTNPNLISPVAPAATDILTNTLSQNAPMSFLDDDITGSKGDRTRRIEILKSEMITLNTTDHADKDYDLNFQLNGPTVKDKQHIKYASGGLVTPVSGGIYLLIVSDLDPTPHPTQMAINGLSKLVFYDN